MSELSFEASTSKAEVFEAVQNYLGEMSLTAATVDAERPWGGFFVIDEDQTGDFIGAYFPELSRDEVERGGRLSPKILVVEPGKRLSWQYHDRREELWKVIGGPVGVITSSDDSQGPVKELSDNEVTQFGTQTRHRLVGLKSNWGIIAEIWQHTQPDNPSNEGDIIRVQDDFDR